MDEKVINRMNMVALLAKSDHIYFAMLKDFGRLKNAMTKFLGRFLLTGRMLSVNLYPNVRR